MRLQLCECVDSLPMWVVKAGSRLCIHSEHQQRQTKPSHNFHVSSLSGCFWHSAQRLAAVAELIADKVQINLQTVKGMLKLEVEISRDGVISFWFENSVILVSSQTYPVCSCVYFTLRSNNTRDHRIYIQREICLPNWALNLHYPPAVWLTVPDSHPTDNPLMRILDRAPHFYLLLPGRADWYKMTGFCCQVSPSQCVCSVCYPGRVRRLSRAVIASTVTVFAATTASLALWF